MIIGVNSLRPPIQLYLCRHVEVYDYIFSYSNSNFTLSEIYGDVNKRKPNLIGIKMEGKAILQLRRFL